MKRAEVAASSDSEVEQRTNQGEGTAQRSHSFFPFPATTQSMLDDSRSHPRALGVTQSRRNENERTERKERGTHMQTYRNPNTNPTRSPAYGKNWHMALRFPVRSHAGREIWVAVDESCGGLGIGGRGGLQTAV
jgi:hypothetical protein